MGSRGGLVVYVTSHGFGHLNRSVAVINRIRLDIPVTIRCHPNLFHHWGERLRRPAALAPHESDSGAVNPPGDSASTDGRATLANALRIYEEAWPRVEEEAQWLRDSGASAVLCDLPYLPFVAAKRAGVPAFGLGNFTWSEIYEPHAERIGGDALRLVAQIREAYSQGTAVFRCEPALRLAEFPEVIDVGMVVTPGIDRQEELKRSLGLSESDKVVYFYIGRYGQNDLGWERLARLGDRGIHFVGFHPAPGGPLANLHVVPAEDWTGADLAASADVMVAKAGYGTVCEAMVAGTPMIYPPRSGFAEFEELDRALRDWGGGVLASSRDFHELRLERHLDHALSLRPGPAPFPADGAAKVAARLNEVCREALAAR